MRIILYCLLALAGPAANAGARAATIGSKQFAESAILAEIASQALEREEKAAVSRRFNMGSTGVLFEALRAGAIDVYPDYVGTLSQTILKDPSIGDGAALKRALERRGLTVSESLGFQNTYAIATTAAFAAANHLRAISDLKRLAPTLRAAFSYEFMDRADGYPGLVARYGLAFANANVRRLEHSLVYEALSSGAVDAIEVYSTDAKVERMGLTILDDDLGFFPRYDSVWVARLAFTREHPDEWKRLRSFEGGISRDRMAKMNAEVEIQKRSYADAARDFLGYARDRAADAAGFWPEIWLRTKEHLALVGAALLFSLAVGIPLGILSARVRAAGQAILILSSVVQTIPALALLAFLIPVLGIGTKPALAALCLYSLLPVVLNTLIGMQSVDAQHLECARALGLNSKQILWRIALPIASPSILAGVKTATIVSVGTATLAALIGAGGYGAIIVSGLSLNDRATILAGAIPAAAMALIAYGLFSIAEVTIVPRGLRRKRG